jgi:hypothetical protein
MKISSQSRRFMSFLEFVVAKMKRGRNNINDIDAVDGRTPLFIACKNGNLNDVTQLLEDGASVHIPDDQDTSPLAVAARGSHIEVVRVLLSCGQRIQRHISGALVSIVVNGTTHEMFDLLFDALPDDNALTDSDVIDYACRWADAYIVKRLFDRASLYSQFTDGYWSRIFQTLCDHRRDAIAADIFTTLTKLDCFPEHFIMVPHLKKALSRCRFALARAMIDFDPDATRTTVEIDPADSPDIDIFTLVKQYRIPATCIRITQATFARRSWEVYRVYHNGPKLVETDQRYLERLASMGSVDWEMPSFKTFLNERAPTFGILNAIANNYDLLMAAKPYWMNPFIRPLPIESVRPANVKCRAFFADYMRWRPCVQVTRWFGSHFFRYAKTFLLICKRLNVLTAEKDVRYLIIEYIARGTEVNL